MSQSICEQLCSFVGSYIKPKLNDIARNDNKIRLVHLKNDKENQEVMFRDEQDMTMLILSSHCSKYGQKISNSSCTIVFFGEVHKECATEFRHNSIEDKLLKFIIQQFLHETEPLIPHDTTNYEANKLFTVEELVGKLKTCAAREGIHEIDIVNVTRSDPIESCDTSDYDIKSTTTEGVTLPNNSEELTLSNSSEELAGWLSSIKSETQNITNALKEIGTVNPGGGSMPEQESCYPKPPYFNREEYFVTVDSLLREELKGFRDELSFKVNKLYRDGNVYVGPTRFEITDTAGNTMKVSYLGESKGWSLKVNGENSTFGCDQSQSRAFGIITRYIYDNVYSEKNGNGTVESCKPFNKTDFLTSLKEIPNTKGYEHYFRGRLSGNVSKNPSPFNCSFHPINAAAGLTILSTMVALFTNTTTPAIGYNNSTITNTNLNTTTNRPEQGADAGQIAATAVVTCFSVFSLVMILFAICYRKDLKNYFKNCRGSNIIPKRAYSSENVKFISSRELKEGEDTPSVAIEIQPLLTNNNQPSTPTNGGIKISDEDASKVADAVRGSSSLKRVQQLTAPQHTQGDGSQNPQCSGAGAATGSEGVPMSRNSLNAKFDNILEMIPSDKSNGDQPKIIQAADEVVKTLGSTLETALSPSNEGANSLLQAIQVESPAQQASR